jgi:hypothetical protein
MRVMKLPLKGCNYTLAGHSKSAEATYFYVPELKLAIDMGFISKNYSPTTFLITHTHAVRFKQCINS